MKINLYKKQEWSKEFDKRFTEKKSGYIADYIDGKALTAKELKSFISTELKKKEDIAYVKGYQDGSGAIGKVTVKRKEYFDQGYARGRLEGRAEGRREALEELLKLFKPYANEPLTGNVVMLEIRVRLDSLNNG